MNEMYSMSIVAHYYSVVMIFLVILAHLLLLRGVGEFKKYKRIQTLYNPLAFTAIGATMFTGVVMMAAKHLSFTLENIAMIVASAIYIYLEAKRLKVLKRTREFSSEFKSMSQKVFIAQFVLVLAVSIWMKMV
ncbi:MAG: hypothetical protein RBS91_03195 [Sulfurimonadaceae bacterium]|jgi:hypothetical protein|nr:hypothetical protein [Sulfurimonadaceae bacterium]